MKIILFNVLLIVIILLTANNSSAETFRWIDESGKIRIGIKPSAQSDSVKNNNSMETNSPTPVIEKPVVFTPAEPASPIAAKPEVIKYPDSVESSKLVKDEKLVKDVADKEDIIRKKAELAAKKNADARNKDMCGVFIRYVSDYNEKVKDCSSSHCDVYKRSLVRYKKKQKTYCQ